MEYSDFLALTKGEDDAHWCSVANSTDPIDRQAAGEGVAAFYAAALLPRPKVIFVESALAMFLAGGLANGLRRMCRAGGVHYQIGQATPTALRALDIAADALNSAITTLGLTGSTSETLVTSVVAATKAATAYLKWPAPDWDLLQNAVAICGEDLREMADGLIVGVDPLFDTPGGLRPDRLHWANSRLRVIAPGDDPEAESIDGVYYPSWSLLDGIRETAFGELAKARGLCPDAQARPALYDHAAELLRCVFMSGDECDWSSPAYESAAATQRVALAKSFERNLPAWQAHRAMTLNASAMFLTDRFCILAERPSEVHCNGNGPLHNDRGPSIRWRDGVCAWAINDVVLPIESGEQIVMRPETQTLEEIDREPSIEVKRIRIERFGWMRYLSDIHATVVERRRNDIEGTLEVLCRRGDICALVCHCPSTGRVFVLEVPGNIKTCDQAQKWLWASDSSPYGPARIIGRS